MIAFLGGIATGVFLGALVYESWGRPSLGEVLPDRLARKLAPGKAWAEEPAPEPAVEQVSRTEDRNEQEKGEK